MPESAFTPIRPNPYIVGNPVRDRAMFFGREAEFELVRKRFGDSARGGLLVFCGERRSGKTSILFQILDQRLGPDFIPVLIDMQSMAITNETDLLTKIAREILDALGPGAAGIAPPDFAAGANHAATLHAFIESVLRAHPDRKLILLFDEYELFENKIDAGVLGPDVLFILSSLMENQSVFLVFTGSQHLEQRRRKYWRILGQSIWKQISYLDRGDALRLIREPVAGRVHYGDNTVEAIYRLTAGQPFYTQAVCQNLVDQLNETRTHEARVEALDEVVDGLVNNPLPQMIFLWDSLERDEKLALALLAEALPDAATFAGGVALHRLIRTRDYPLEMSRGRIATALESLFRAELLSKSDATQPPGYAFRMDLWRHWVRRMHSVWQVMRETGIGIRTGGVRIGSLRFPVAAVATVALAVAAVVGLRFMAPREPGTPDGNGAVIPEGPRATLALEADPGDARIHLNGRAVGQGAFLGTVAAEANHTVRLTAPGHADTTFPLRLAAGDSVSRSISLRPLFGDLRIETSPPAARITLNGVARGTSPVVLRGLEVARAQVLEASLPGHATARQSVTVNAGRITSATLVLAQAKTDLMLTSSPPGAAILLDGVASGRTPVRIADLAIARHALVARLDGYAPAESVVAVTENTGQVHLTLSPEPPGVLIVQGDLPAQIFVDGALVAEYVQNSGPQELRGGAHQVRVVLVSGQVIEKSIAVSPRERVHYDYSRDSVARTP